MAERFTISQAARKLGISRRTLYNWLEQEQDTSQKLHGERTFTRLQLERLAEKHGRRLESDFRDLEAVDAALTERIEALEARVAALEQQRSISRGGEAISRPSQTHPGAFSTPQPVAPKVPRAAGVGLRKIDAARLVAARHGVEANTAKGWPWPAEALVSEEAALRWALSYVARMDSFRRPRSWRGRCDVPDCPCQQAQPE